MIWWQKKPLIDVIKAYDNVTSREQSIILVTIVIILLLVGYLLIVEPVVLTNAELTENKNALVSKNLSLSEKINNIKNEDKQDPNIPLREELNRILVDGKNLQEKINLLTQALVAPRQMVSLLEGVLIQDKQLKLLSFINLPEEAMSIVGNNLVPSPRSKEVKNNNQIEGAASEALIYRHAFDVELEATYDGALQYLKRLDGLPWQLFWQDLRFQTTKYPKGKLNIRIYTLSMSKDVLGV